MLVPHWLRVGGVELGNCCHKQSPAQLLQDQRTEMGCGLTNILRTSGNRGEVRTWQPNYLRVGLTHPGNTPYASLVFVEHLYTPLAILAGLVWGKDGGFVFFN